MKIALEKQRVSKGKNRSDLARDAKMQPGMICWIETGRFKPYDVQLKKLADALGWEGDPVALLDEVSE